jgi:phosphate starvation-inducible PhoH-like protein
VHFCMLNSGDVVRHRLVSDIVDAYSRYDEQQQSAPERQSQAARRHTRAGR